MTVKQLRELARLRLAAQGLVGEGFDDAAATVRHMTAMQGQDLPGAMTSAALRTRGRSRDGVAEAMNEGSIVRTWPMRGTLHLLPAEDLAPILSLTGRRTLQSAARRREQLGVDDPVQDAARSAAVGALEGGRSLRRDELMSLWDDAGLLGVGGRGYHLLLTLSLEGVVCFGPFDGAGRNGGGEQRIVLCEEWIGPPRRVDRDEALAQWALRYFRSHGPATVRDFAWWTKLPLGAIRGALAEVADRLATWTVDGTEFLMAPETPDLLASAGRGADSVLLLPGFDEFLLGYGDRGAALSGAHAGKVVPGNNGVFRGTVVAGGRVVGTWKRKGSGKAVRIDAEPFGTFTKTVESALPRRFAALP